MVHRKSKKFKIRNGYYVFPDSGKYVHRWIVEKAIGRKLKSWEVVHHIDGNKLNNDLSNLEVINKRDHSRLHLRDRALGDGIIAGLARTVSRHLRSSVQNDVDGW